jgi:hypothetical protein
MHVRGLKLLLAGAALALGVAGAANAALPVYGSPGSENPVVYNLTAAADGDVVAYFALDFVSAAYDENLGLKVNGVDTNIVGLENHQSNYGDALNFGPVHAGDQLDFYINVFNTGDVWHSIKGLNWDGTNHIFAANYGGDIKVPAGTYVAFEDLPACCGSDFNYHDEAFVFTNVRGGAPEPLTWSLMIMGFGAAGAMLRRARTLSATA